MPVQGVESYAYISRCLHVHAELYTLASVNLIPIGCCLSGIVIIHFPDIADVHVSLMPVQRSQRSYTHV